ncbi:kinetochore complex Sim4 subunit Fta1-domain-containing protein [Annulohypoxylon maeteangense]|uniref:kinetochore complex Sim4 subunit Fta1-domain-containing protein n=1 Tax=Annulohypoxylon maeteangense TaxID=1927788 RepID=UPI002007BE74|nr:kinetochore complex Sim4 subunit Fta1-domain-containing protein [Annulohypoxylon maeteangense]KAI0880585.1 kinetochore complex Sim4 subunit Fta1-domain-containing protein [Annulohypoxylon maeteangense]
MPPRRRKPTPPPSPSPPPPPVARSPSSGGSDAPSGSPSAADNSWRDDSEPPRFFNTTFTTYRVSPLYLGPQGLTSERLELLSRRLRDVLVGDVVRGVQVGLESDSGALGRTGALYGVEWRWVDGERILGKKGSGREGSVELGNGDDEQASNGSGRRVMCIELRYENARFGALLVPDLAGNEDSAGSGSGYQPSWTWNMDGDTTTSRKSEVDTTSFLHLPLLLFRMPAPLKSVLVDFISSTFDCRISPLALGTRSLISSWEAWLSDNGSSNGRKALSKDVLITLGFHIEPPKQKSQVLEGSGEGEVVGEHQGQKPEALHLGLKSVDITIPASDVHRFLRAGEKLDSESNDAYTKKRKVDSTTTLSDEQQSRRRRKLAGGRDEDGWAWRARNSNNDNSKEIQPEIIDQPFTEALAEYLWHHLGLDLFHPGIRILRVACDGFALSDGRFKLFTPGRHHSDEEEESAVWKLMRGLVQRAKGNRSGWSADVMKGSIEQ